MTTEERPFGFWTATALIVGGTVGGGIFVLPAQLAPFGASGVAGWIVAITGAVVMAWVIARLFAVRPEATGMVDAVAAGTGPLPAVVVGWSYWVGCWSSVSVLALASVNYLSTFWPWIGSSAPVSGSAAVVLVWASTILTLRGPRAAGGVQLVAMPLKLLPLVAVVAILIGIAVASPARFAATPHAPFELGQLTPALGLAFFALIGFESAGMAAARVADPARNIPRATMAGVLMTGLLYLIVSTGIVYAMPPVALAASGAPVAVFVEHYWGTAAGLLIAAFAMISTIGCLACNVLFVGELPLGMARAGLVPAVIGRTNRHDAPATILIVGGTLSSILILSNTTRSLAGLMTFMLNLTAAATIWVYIGACASAWTQRIARPAAAVGMLLALWALIGTGVEAAGWSIALMLTAIPLYFLRPTAALAEQPA